VSANEKQDGRSGEEVQVGRSPGKAVNTYIGGLYYQVTDCNRKGCDLGSL